MLAGQRAWSGMNTAQIIHAVAIQNEQLQLPEGIASPFHHLLQRSAQTSQGWGVLQASLLHAFSFLINTVEALSCAVESIEVPVTWVLSRS